MQARPHPELRYTGLRPPKMKGGRTIQVKRGHAMQHSPEFVEEEVNPCGFCIFLDQPGSDYGLSCFKTALRDAADSFPVNTCNKNVVACHLHRSLFEEPLNSILFAAFKRTGRDERVDEGA